MSKQIKIEGVIANVDNHDVTTEELRRFTDAFLKFVEGRDMAFGGGLDIVESDE